MKVCQGDSGISLHDSRRMKILPMNVDQGDLLGRPSDCIALIGPGLGEHRIGGLAGGGGRAWTRRSPMKLQLQHPDSAPR